MSLSVPRGVVVRGALHQGYRELLTLDALKFLAALHRHFDQRRLGLLRYRERKQQELDSGVLPTYPEHTAWIREGNWKGPHIPRDLADRRIEITGPVDRKMVINALNSGAKVFMADFEDSSSPTWKSMMDGQINLRDAVRGTATLQAKGKTYKLKPRHQLATLMVRPRGWHLDEAHILVDTEPMSGSLVDFGLYFFHNAHELLARGSGPYFYLAKLEGYRGARLWNEVFVFAQEYCGVPRGTIRATVLLETILAAFEMDEIIYELREHSAGMNCGRWDYIFSFIKKFRNHRQLVLPDRVEVGMNKPFMAAYVKKVVQTCHKRGVHAMGGMAAQIPVKGDKAANDAALNKVRNDKLREVKAGHDGSWVAHPALIPTAMEVFDRHMPQPNQIDNIPDTSTVTPADLLDTGTGGSITEAGLRANVSVGLAYLEAWLRGVGCVPLHNLMEDAATAEISRTQVWQWIKHEATINMASGSRQTISKALVEKMLDEELAHIRAAAGQGFVQRKWQLAAKLYARLMLSDELAEFMTSEAYPHITAFTTVPSTTVLRSAL